MKQNSIVPFLLAAPLFVLSACSDSNDLSGMEGNVDSVIPSGSHTAHTDVGDGIWPPQPSGITNVEGYPASARSGAEHSVIDSARRNVMNNPDTQNALGDNFRQFDGSLGDSKSDITASFVFYNYSNNTTVEAKMGRDGSVSSDIYPATEWQPPEHVEEVAEAIMRGEEDLLANGYETNGLQGTAMLAFPPLSQLADTNRHYYPERIMYVTFGEGDGAVPIYSALVNLSTGAITESGLVK